MRPDDAKRFRDLLSGMSRMYSQEPDVLVLDAYWAALHDWSLADFEAAAQQLMRTSVFMPRPADFHKLRRAGELTPGEAFARAWKHAGSGAWKRGLMGEPLIDGAVAALGGYVVLAKCLEENAHWLERRFTEHYGSLQDAEETRRALPQIAAAPGGQRLTHVKTVGPTAIGKMLAERKP